MNDLTLIGFFRHPAFAHIDSACTASRDGTVRLWSAAGACTSVLDGDGLPLSALACDNEQKYVFSIPLIKGIFILPVRAVSITVAISIPFSVAASLRLSVSVSLLVCIHREDK